MYKSIPETSEYWDGVRAAQSALEGARLPCRPPWRGLRPDYAQEPGYRGYCWYQGFRTEWNWDAHRRGWPEWTVLRLIVTRGLPGDGE